MGTSGSNILLVFVHCLIGGTKEVWAQAFAPIQGQETLATYLYGDSQVTLVLIFMLKVNIFSIFRILVLLLLPF
jgi:hypothetical protein